jgi:hypothetical protein
LTSGAVGAGAHQYRWDRYDAAGRRLSRGVYWIQLSAGGRDVTRKIVLSRP